MQLFTTSILATSARAAAAALLLGIASEPLRAQAWFFEDVTDDAQAGVVHALSSGYWGEPDMMSGGAAAADVDGDGFVDLFVLRGDAQMAVLLRNLGDGSFVDASAASGLGIVTPLGMPNGATFADVDGNGAPDLLVGGVEYANGAGTGTAPLRLFLNDGDGSFTESLTSGLMSDRNVWSAAFGDYDRDGDLDLALGQWTKTTGGTGQLWRNEGDGTFTDVGVAAGIADVPRGAHPDPDAPDICTGRDTDPVLPPRHSGSLLDQDYSFTPNFADIDGDGWPDLLLAADFCTSRVFRNDGDGTFTDVTGAAIRDENGMGAAVADYDNDGDLDWFVTSIIDADGVVENGNWGITGNKLYRNDGAGGFVEVAAEAGVAFGDWGWGACFADFNNDGWLDLFHVNGMQLPPGAGETQFWDDPARLFMANGDGTFTEQGAALGVADTGQGRGVACFDYDRDGDIDLYINNHDGESRLLRNVGGNLGGWLTVRLRGTGGNREGIGARITVTSDGGIQLREIAAGNHFLSSSPAEAHVGLGSDSIVDVVVRWPDGHETVLEDVAANQMLTIALTRIFDDGFETPVQ